MEYKMKKSERLVLFYDASIKAHSRSFAAPKPLSIKRAFELIELIPVNQMIRDMRKGKEQIYISDWKREGEIISILINKSDKDISDPVFTIPKEKKRRTAEKKDKEGQDFSIHLIAKLSSDDAQPALLLAEYCTGLGISVIQKLLTQLINDAKSISPEDFEQNHPDGSLDTNGKPKKYNVTYKLEIEGHISEDLISDLNNGKIQSIELITEKEQYTNFDEDGYIKEKCKTLVLTLKDEEHPINDKFRRIKSVLINKKDDYSHARIKFKSPTGVDRTVELDTGQATTEMYVKKERLTDFDIDLKSSYDKFCGPILNKMKAIVNEGM
jgi:hypothetical protein